MNSRTRLALRLAGTSCVATVAATFALAGPAFAEAPLRAGWWNLVSANGSAAPATTPAGELHVAVAPGQVLAYSALAYQVGSAGSATLTVAVDTSTEQGTPSLLACPTLNTSWRNGDDQPSSAAPGYNCAAHSYAGVLSSSGKSVTFLLDSGAQVAAGLYSVAIVPATTNNVPVLDIGAPTDATPPFSVDLATPGGESFSGAGSQSPPIGGPGAGGSGGSGSSGSTPGSTGASTTSAPPSRTTPAVASGAGTTGPVVTGGSLPAGAATTTTSTGAAPAVAGTGANNAPVAQRAVAASTPTTGRTRNVAVGLLAAMGLVLLATNTGFGRRRSAFTGAVGPVGVERGLGRFAKPRQRPPHPLI
ncbi:MAG TPA: hypothetical protein VNG13_07955 [Mycobacteriales bacterium]|nr:hypothetical protein [Mycobacteriales bacterium]